MWDVRRLVQLSDDLPTQPVPLQSIAEIDENYWFQSDDQIPTGRNIVEHMKLVEAADLAYPILLCAEGRLMDGMHRVLKAQLQGRETVLAKRFEVTPQPDHRNVSLAELPYDD